MTEQQPHWQPITMLPVFSEMISGMLETSTDQLGYMQLVFEKPHVLDDATLHRVIEQYTNQLNDHWLFEEQFSRWQRESLRPSEAREVDRLIKQIAQLKESSEAILKIAHSIAHATIDKIMDMDELELIDALASGKVKYHGSQ